MCENELIIKLIGIANKIEPGIDIRLLKEKFETILYDYEIQPKNKSLTVMTDIREKIVLYLAIKQLEGLSNQTLYNYKLHLVKFANCINKNIKDITTMDVRMYLSSLLNDKKLKDTSMSNITDILRSFFSKMVIEGYITKNPMDQIKSMKKSQRLRKTLHIDEIEQLREGCVTTRQKALFEFLFSTGLRVSEVVNVKINEINWGERSITVIGKENKERKTYFSSKAKLYLKNYLAERKEYTDEALFVSVRSPYKKIKSRAIEKEIKKIAEQATVVKSIYPHILRHSMASIGLQQGMSLTTLQSLLGHSSPVTTEIYAEISNNNVKYEYQKCFI